MPRTAAGIGAPSTVTSGSSRCSPRSRCMKNGSSPSAILYSRLRSRSTNASSRFTAARRLWQARTVSTSRWPAESSSSSRSPSARSPSGPGFRALMNMLVIEQGPEISMPGFRRSSGTGGTFQSPAARALSGAGPGMIPCSSARRSTRSRSARNACARGVKASCIRTRYARNAGVNSASAPSTGATRTRSAAELPCPAGAAMAVSVLSCGVAGTRP